MPGPDKTRSEPDPKTRMSKPNMFRGDFYRVQILGMALVYIRINHFLSLFDKFVMIYSKTK